MNFIERMWNQWLEYKTDKRICRNCEFLRIQLEAERIEREKLLDRITKPNIPVEIVTPQPDLKPMGKRYVPFRVRQQMIEQEQLQSVELLKKKLQEINHPTENEVAKNTSSASGGQQFKMPETIGGPDERSSLEILEDEVLGGTK